MLDPASLLKLRIAFLLIHYLVILVDFEYSSHKAGTTGGGPIVNLVVFNIYTHTSTYLIYLIERVLTVEYAE